MIAQEQETDESGANIPFMRRRRIALAIAAMAAASSMPAPAAAATSCFGVTCATATVQSLDIACEPLGNLWECHAMLTGALSWYSTAGTSFSGEWHMRLDCTQSCGQTTTCRTGGVFAWLGTGVQVRTEWTEKCSLASAPGVQTFAVTASVSLRVESRVFLVPVGWAEASDRAVAGWAAAGQPS